jgi:hypothetical protein
MRASKERLDFVHEFLNRVFDGDLHAKRVLSFGEWRARGDDRGCPGGFLDRKASDMKEPWRLAASDGTLAAPAIIKLYSKRWTIEPSFRDSKDLRFGMGMSALRINDPQRRDRLLLLNAFAILLLTIWGAAGESLGMDRQLRTSTVKRRVHSLFRQGCLLYDLIPNMPEARLRPLIERYGEFLRQNAAFSEAFGFV